MPPSVRSEEAVLGRLRVHVSPRGEGERPSAKRLGREGEGARGVGGGEKWRFQETPPLRLDPGEEARSLGLGQPLPLADRLLAPIPAPP